MLSFSAAAGLDADAEAVLFLRFHQKNNAAATANATTGMTTAIATIAPVESPDDLAVDAVPVDVALVVAPAVVAEFEVVVADVLRVAAKSEL